MKKEIHEKMNPVIFRDLDAGVDFVTTSTLTSDKKETIDGVEYNIVTIEISSENHPAYTGKEKVLDSAGRVERFKSRIQKAKKQS